jgi:hypothetical protein
MFALPMAGAASPARRGSGTAAAGAKARVKMIRAGIAERWQNTAV